jgi:tetratricopeptide (TPR) repeat protein
MHRWARAIPGPGSGHFHNHYGYAYVEHGLFTEAEREFRAYIRVSPGEANAHDSLAELFLITGRPELAIGQYDRALRLNPMFGWSHFGRAYAQAALGRYDEAFGTLATLQGLGSRAAVPAVFISMIEALFQQRVGRHRAASASLERARRVARELGDVGAEADADLFAAMLAVERGQRARALEYADRAARIGANATVDIMRVRRPSLAHLMAGIAEARAGRLAEARARLAAQRSLHTGGDDYQILWQAALEAEIALAEGRLDAADRAFDAAAGQVAASFAIYPALVTIINNLPVRDGPARTALARGDFSAALAQYRRLNEPDVASRWHAVFEPQYALAAAEIATRAGDTTVSRGERARFRQVWKGE